MKEMYFQQLQTEIALRNLTASTGESYQNNVKYFLTYTEKQADEFTLEDVRRFILSKKEEGLAAPTLNLYPASIRFFVRHVLHKLWDWDTLPRMKIDRTLPTLLTQEEIQSILNATENLKHKAMLSTMYSSGLRVSEVCRLHHDDISRRSMHIHVRHTKSRTDRYAILSKRNLNILTEYWFHCGKPKDILFPSTMTGGYIDKSTLNQVLKKSALRAGIKKKVHCHLLRHGFACHLLEAGVEKTYIQLLLGHLSPHSTDVYLHMTNKAFMGIKSPFDTVGGESDE